MDSEPRQSDEARSADSAPRGVLVVGAGVTGIKAALELAESGVPVTLADVRHHIGGTLAQLEKQFPTDHCGMCRMLPSAGAGGRSWFCLRREVVHENITLMPGTTLAKLEGEAGAFAATLRTRSSGIEDERCIACGRCVEVCPVEVPDPFNEGLATRKAVYVRNPQGVPNTVAVDFAACTRCGACVEVCPTKAVTLDDTERERVLPAAAVILTAGFEEFVASSMGQYGHRRWPNVLTGIEFERSLSQVNPEGGRLKRPSDGAAPKRIAFLQCVGSRDVDRPWCSAACCMFALKECALARALDDAVETHVFAMDLRAFGKGYHRYLEDARSAGVRIRRGRVAAVREDPATKSLELVVADERGNRKNEIFDLVVLSVGFTPPPGASDLLAAAGLTPGTGGFCPTLPLAPVDTPRPGVFVAGPLSEPKDIPESITQGTAAAARALALVPPAGPAPVADEGETRDGAGRDPAAAVFLCACGGTLGEDVALEPLARELALHPGVVLAETTSVLCAAGAPRDLARKAAEAGADRILFGACVPYRFASLFRDGARGEGFHPALVETVNLKEGVSWVHEGAGARDKAASLMHMGLERLLLEVPHASACLPARREVLVAGGGVAGLTAALAAADAGLTVHLIEKGKVLGGSALEAGPSLEPGDPRALVRSLVERVEARDSIHVRLETAWTALAGTAGDFVSRVEGPGGEEAIAHGAGIVAVGSGRIAPAEYLCGSDPRALDHLEFGRRLESGALDPMAVTSVALFLCSGLRSDPRPWCARTCCSEGLGAVEKLLDANPKARAWVFHRDVMTYGFLEEGYRRLREKGAIFVRYERDAKPVVRAAGDGLVVEAFDPALGARLVLPLDLAVTAAGWDAPDGAGLAKILGVALDADGFFEEADVKFRPVDFLKDGLTVAGLAHSPRTVSETVTQALAAGARAASLLSKGELQAGVLLVSEVDARRCSACGTCVEACPYDARFLDEETGLAVVREAACQGCGACSAACPNDAAKLAGFKHRQVSAMIDAALGF